METENKLAVIVKEAGLEKAKADYILENFIDYFSIAAEWEKRAKEIVVTDESQKDVMAIARVGRLTLKKKRIAIEKARKRLKEQSLREGRAIDGVANVLKALIIPIEEHLERQEHFVEHKRAEEERLARIEAEKKAEEERIAKEKAEAEERERIRLENEKLRKEKAKAEAKLRAEREAAGRERRKQEAKIATEKAMAEAERRAAQEKERKAAQEKARLEAELKAKAEAERKAQEEKKAMERRLKDVIVCPKCGYEIKLQGGKHEY